MVREMAKGFARGAEVENSRFYMGSLMSFLVNGREAEGRAALIEGIARRGNEPPPHAHLWEHEIWYILEGESEFFVEGEERPFVLRSGEMIFIPRGKAHALYIRSDAFRFLIFVQAAGNEAVGLDAMFHEISEPATSMVLPEKAVTYAMSDPGEVVKMAGRHGTHVLAPEEVETRLPNYPGFGSDSFSTFNT